MPPFPLLTTPGTPPVGGTPRSMRQHHVRVLACQAGCHRAAARRIGCCLCCRKQSQRRRRCPPTAPGMPQPAGRQAVASRVSARARPRLIIGLRSVKSVNLGRPAPLQAESGGWSCSPVQMAAGAERSQLETNKAAPSSNRNSSGQAASPCPGHLLASFGRGTCRAGPTFILGWVTPTSGQVLHAVTCLLPCCNTHAIAVAQAAAPGPAAAAGAAAAPNTSLASPAALPATPAGCC